MSNPESMEHFPGEKPHDLGVEGQASAELAEEIMALREELADPDLDPQEAATKRAHLEALEQAQNIESIH